MQVINAGVPGNTTQDGCARFERDVLSRDPDIVIIQNRGMNVIPQTGQACWSSFSNSSAVWPTAIC